MVINLGNRQEERLYDLGIMMLSTMLTSACILQRRWQIRITYPKYALK